MSEKRTPSKPCTNKLLESVQGKLSNSPFGCDSAFRFLPNISTPPNKFTKIFNPFEPHLTERLHLPVFSPSVFKKEIKTEDKFKWTIDDISNLKPADIDENNVQHLTEHDPELEFTAQAKIEKFFSEKHIAPSPLNAIRSVPLISDSLTPIKKPEVAPQFSDGVTQTILSLPPQLPDHIADLLKPYFSYTLNQQQGQTNANSSLYREIFERHDENVCRSPSTVLTSPAPSCNLSPRLFSPCDSNKADDNQEVFDNPHFGHFLSECNLSPIGSSSPRLPTRKVDMMSYMSVDNSFNVVPDFQNIPSDTNFSTLESFHEVAKEVLSESTVNWDVEYKHVSLASQESDSENERMDVSNSNTPKSHFLSNQPKKLSQERRVKNALFSDTDTTDAGYHTGAFTMSEESSYLFASTPTKNQEN